MRVSRSRELQCMKMQGASSFGYVIEEHWSIRF